MGEEFGDEGDDGLEIYGAGVADGIGPGERGGFDRFVVRGLLCADCVYLWVQVLYMRKLD